MKAAGAMPPGLDDYKETLRATAHIPHMTVSFRPGASKQDPYVYYIEGVQLIFPSGKKNNVILRVVPYYGGVRVNW